MTMPSVKLSDAPKRRVAAVEPLPEAASPLVIAEQLALKVPIFQPDDRTLLSNPSRLLTDLYTARTKRGVKTILDDISFTLAPGQRLGIIGGNGAGKSTLLRVLAGIYVPTSGELTVNGTAKGLFDISLGMNQEATGLENIYMRGLQMGLKLGEIKELVPEIVAFAELQDVIEQPFNTYSSGMRLRLAVSISTMIEPDILLLDEWLGAGDARFSEKVKKRMEGLVERSRGLIIATHNEALMKSLCTHGLLLSRGKMVACGELLPVLEQYKELQSTPPARPR
jgi:ABC-type polysaccharide/polyol phosphate transport system ATPase subunit